MILFLGIGRENLVLRPPPSWIARGSTRSSRASSCSTSTGKPTWVPIFTQSKLGMQAHVRALDILSLDMLSGDVVGRATGRMAVAVRHLNVCIFFGYFRTHPFFRSQGIILFDWITFSRSLPIGELKLNIRACQRV